MTTEDLKLSGEINAIKFSQAVIQVNVRLETKRIILRIISPIVRNLQTSTSRIAYKTSELPLC
jgi:hypothetical protein